MKKHLRAFVKHPLSDAELDLENNNITDLSSLVVTEMDITGNPKYPNWAPLITRPDKFIESRNPVHAIESIILCHESGLYPPLDVMQWLVSSLKDWHQENGNRSMDNAMGLKRKGQTGNAMREALREEVLQNLMLEIHRIKVIFSLTNIAASEMVAARLHDTNWNETEVSLPNLDSSTLQDKYERAWARIFNESGLNKTLEGMSAEDKKQILSHYPDYSYDHLPEIHPLK